VLVLRDAVKLFILSLLSSCTQGRDVVLGDLPFFDAAPETEGSAPDGSSETDGRSPSDAILPEAAADAVACAPPRQPVPASLRAFLTEAVGFGRLATGGSDGCVYHVTHAGDSGLGSLRDGAERDEPLWIVFDMSGDIELASAITLGPNKTVDGRGQRITIRNFGFNLGGAAVSNVVIESLTFVGNAMGSNNDAIQIADAAHLVWVDHCALSNYGDGLIDITHGATDVTVSWSVFSMHRYAVLIGRHELDTEDRDIRVTLHNNWWNQIDSYAPRLRFGKVHLFNNLIDRWRTAASACTMDGEIYSEGNVFIAGNDKQALATKAGDDSVRGRAKSVGDVFRGDAVKDETGADLVFLPSDYYKYTAAPAEEAERAVIASAGPRP
jgi:pectate lyase